MNKNLNKCKVGDAIFSSEISEYSALIDKSLIKKKDYVESIYTNISNIMIDKGYKREWIQPSVLDIGDNKVFSDRHNVKDSDKVNYVLKVIIKRKSEFDYVSVNTQISRIGAMAQNILILESGNIAYINFLRKKLNSNISKMCNGYLKPYFKGYIIQDILCNPIGISDFLEQEDKIKKFDKYISILNNRLDFINTNLESCEIVRFYTDRGNTLVPSDYNLYIGELDKTKFSDIIKRYQDWYYGDDYSVGDKVLILSSDIRASIKLMLKEVKVDKRDIDLRIVDKGDKWLLGLYCRNNINPYLLIKGLYNKVKLLDIYYYCEFLLVDSYKESSKLYRDTIKGMSDEQALLYRNGVCNCKEPLYYSCINKKIEKVCPKCKMMKMLEIYLKRVK